MEHDLNQFISKYWDGRISIISQLFIAMSSFLFCWVSLQLMDVGSFWWGFGSSPAKKGKQCNHQVDPKRGFQVWQKLQISPTESQNSDMGSESTNRRCFIDFIHQCQRASMLPPGQILILILKKMLKVTETKTPVAGLNDLFTTMYIYIYMCVCIHTSIHIYIYIYITLRPRFRIVKCLAFLSWHWAKEVEVAPDVARRRSMFKQWDQRKRPQVPERISIRWGHPRQPSWVVTPIIWTYGRYTSMYIYIYIYK